ncbi:MAG TPA: phosphatidylserine decarboxylase [Opitutales bacterium]|nr:phosphatidylserine decarboxylase [Opitutales bacterium]
MSQSTDKVQYFDRYQGRVVEEAVYGEAWLRFVYGNPLGRMTRFAAVKRAWFSLLFGLWMDSKWSAGWIGSFVRKYDIDLTQFEPPQSGEWKNFNEFFARRITPGARPVDADPRAVVFPADGRHTVYPDGADLSGLVVKGRAFSLSELLGGAETAQRFEGGALVVSRLCPTDYHRFHFPVAGTPSASIRLPGPLDSVSPVAIAAGARSLVANKRELTLLDTEKAGKVALVEVGAACVGKIVQNYAPNRPVAKGAEKGRFLFGGSTVISVFEPGRIVFAEDLLANSAKGIETYARMGDRLGTLR